MISMHSALLSPVRSFSNKLPIFLALLLSIAVANAAEYYVAPSGTASGDGSIAKPWDIYTAFQTKAASIRPRDTIWLRGGTYGNGGRNAVYSYLRGVSADGPIYVRQYPGERATINGALWINGNYTWYWGFEVTNTKWDFPRSTGQPGSFPDGKPGDAVFFLNNSTGNKLINMIIHDGADGIADQQEGKANEHYGNLVYNNGWRGPDRGHGHSLYYQNAGPLPKVSQENITYGAFDIGIQAYGSDAGPVTNLLLDGNVAFNSGVPGGHRVDNILFLGGGWQRNIQVTNSVFYNPLDTTPAETGYNRFLGGGADLLLRNNWFVGGTPTGYQTLQISNYQQLTFQGNNVVGPINLSGIGSASWGNNKYFKATRPAADTTAQTSNANPTGQTIFVRPNKYEPGRANIIVMNWDKTPTVTVDLTPSLLQIGTPFEVRDSQNFWGGPIVSGVYDGSPVTLPMRLTAVSKIESASFATPPHTSAEFNVFILLPQGTVATPPGQGPMPLAVLNKYALSFSGPAGSAIPAQTVNLKNGGSANTTLNWTATTNQGWLSVSPTSGQYATNVSGDLSVSVNTGGLAPGSYNGIVTVNDLSSFNGPQDISVALDIAIPPPPSGTSMLTGFTLGTARNDFSGFVGMRFTVGATAMTVSHLGRLNVAGNSKPHTLKLVNALTGVDVAGGSVAVTPENLPATFAYAALATPVVLAANTPYLLVSQEAAGGDRWYNLDTFVQSTGDVSINNTVYSDAGKYLTSAGAGRTYGPVNLAYTLGGVVPTPPANPPTNPNPPENPPSNPPENPPSNPPSNPPASGGTTFITNQVVGTVRNNYTGFVGMQFRVGNTPLTVTGLGRFVAPGNSGTHLLKIVNAATGVDVTGGSATVATAGVASGTYAFSGVNSVVLSANTSYFLLSQELSGGDTWYDLNTFITPTGVAGVLSAVYGPGPYFPISSVGSYGPVNFQYQLPAGSTGLNTASFVKFDTSTVGNWTSNYGSEGKGVVGDQIAYQAFATVAVNGAQTYVWAATTPDQRALQKPSNLSSRIAGAWYSNTNFSIDVNLSDGNAHQIALYALDWDNSPRRERIDVIDADTQAVLDTRTLSGFRDGMYAVWNIKGHVVFRVTNLASSNAVIGGIFLGGR